MHPTSARPLGGKRIVVTRASEQAGDLTERLEAAGAQVILFPTVSFAPPDDFKPLDAAIRALSTFDWLIFTSRNCVHFFCNRCRELEPSPFPKSADTPRIAVVGPATAAAAHESGLRVDHLASRTHGAALAEDLAAGMRGLRVLLPRSDRARNDLPAALLQAGALVTQVIAYRTLLPKIDESPALARLRAGEVDAVILASPSALHNLVELGLLDARHRQCEKIALVAIGPTTAAAIRDAGFAVAAEARHSTAAGLVDALCGYYSSAQNTGVSVP